MPMIQPADPVARRLAVRILLITLAVGLPCVLVVEHVLQGSETWLEENLDYVLENSYLFVLPTVVLVLPLIGGSLYLLLLANRIVHAGRFPPPGYAVIRDTRVLQGAAAHRQAWLLRALSILIFAAACAGPAVIWYLFDQMVRPG